MPEPMKATAENKTTTMQLKFDWVIVLENLGLMTTVAPLPGR
jgi:hypothetical protein